MNPLHVEIIRLDPMRVASAYGFGDNPEEQAWQKLVAWAGPRGFLKNLTVNPVFGFNNPYPTQSHPRYGYEFWMKVSPEIEPAGDVRIVEFMGGTYAVTRCDTEGHPEKTVPARWQLLAAWCRESHRTLGRQPALEKFLTMPDDLKHLVIDLYCPLADQDQS